MCHVIKKDQKYTKAQLSQKITAAAHDQYRFLVPPPLITRLVKDVVNFLNKLYQIYRYGRGFYYFRVRKNAVASPFNETIYKFPMQLFVILEKMPVAFFTSEAVTSNHYILFLPKNWKIDFVKLLKYENATSLSFLVDATAVDTYNYDILEEDEDFDFNLPRLLRIENYYSLSNHVRYTLIEGITKNKLFSSSVVFKNSVWLDRELMELYGVFINTVHDSRNLLLEYSFTDNPMLKTYPTEGFLDIYYDFFRDQLCYVKHDYVEL